MNRLIIGADKSPILGQLPERFLFIDDGGLIDRLTLPKRRAVTVFDHTRHTFNPLRRMTYRTAREFLAVLDAVFPEGESTLTKRYSNFTLLNALVSKPRSLATLVPNTKETFDPYQKIQTLLLSPVLERVLKGPTNLSFKGTIIARLDRAALGDFDCFVLANMLISQFDGPVVIPDFGFYATRFHTSLLRQDRLIAGITSFDEVPSFRNQLLLIEDKVGSRCTPDDAELLALYAGIRKGTNAYNEFVERCISPSD